MTLDQPTNDQSISPELPGSSQAAGHPKVSDAAGQQAPVTGRRPAFRDMRRALTPEELASSGVQKILYDELEKSEIESDELKDYVKLFHEADKRAAVLEEKLKTVSAIEVFFGVGVGLGGTIFGLAPFFWTASSYIPGIIAFIIGLLLIAGSCVARLVKQ